MLSSWVLRTAVGTQSLQFEAGSPTLFKHVHWNESSIRTWSAAVEPKQACLFEAKLEAQIPGLWPRKL